MKNIIQSFVVSPALRCLQLGAVWLAVHTCILSAQEPSLSDEQVIERGKQIYHSACAQCHGNQGQGVADAYGESLTGDASLGELTATITDTMPEDDPGQCVGDDARAVAKYIYDAFYSEAAQIRNRPPRVVLAHLTGNQLRQSLSDVYSHFSGISELPKERGVKAIYFTGDRWKNENKKIERTDARLQFDFKHDGPGEGIDPKSFYIYWEGSLLPNETGRYEIVVRSTCSFRMDLGKNGREFIDNHVQSGDKTEFRKSITLTAGRMIPVKIDFIQRGRKTELPPASFSVSWVPPGGVEQIIPTENWIPRFGNAVYSLQTPLPPDDRTYGFERGLAVNRQWDESTTAAAVEFGEILSSELWENYLRQHRDDPNENRERLRKFLREFVEVCFRGPISDELNRVYVNEQIDAEADDTEAIKRVALVAIKSPRFLYPLADSDHPPAYQVANRLTLTLFDSLPSDRWLLDATQKNSNPTEKQIRETASRLVSDYRAHAKMHQFVNEWMNLGHITDITKNQEAFPGFDDALEADLKQSLWRFVDEVLRSDSSDYRQFFNADWSFTSKRISDYYGAAWAAADGNADEQLERSVGDSKLRLGLLTHPYLMSGLSYHDHTSPIHRGLFLLRFMLGRTLRPPAEAPPPLSPDLHPDLTTRERVSLQTSPESCQVCHSRINSLGFTLENFDATGRFRDTERNKSIDASGSYLSRAEEDIHFADAQELARYLINSPDAHRAFVNRAFQYFTKQPAAAYGADRLDQLTKQFVDSGYNVRQLIAEVAVVAATEPILPTASTPANKDH